MGGPIAFSRPIVRRLVLAVAPALLACGTPAAGTGGTVVVVDDAGDSVSVRAPASRVVSLIPATTELLFAIGAGSAVVGRTEWCDYPPEALRVTNLGPGINPNLEAVLSVRPDLVVLYNSAQHAAAAARLRELGIPALRINTDALADVGRVGRLLGRLTGHLSGADSMSAAFDIALAAAGATRRRERRPRVLILAWEQPPMTLGRGSFLSELVERAGGENLFGDVASSSAPVSIEAVSARDPDLILTAANGPASIVDRPEWQVVRAVRERRLLRISGTEYDRPGPRSPGAIRALAARLREVAP
ncbi:MAG TPA: helical backbone metal receptor [Gemmatimonadales bacterium]|nr:helical backbone metal receptor [Gemmatimonadales bacterium]